MIAYSTIGSNDLPKSEAFYTELLSELGAKKLFATERFMTFGPSMKAPMLAICTPYDGQAAAPGNGNMIALSCPDKAAVEAVHAKACALGGTCDGAPDVRGGMFYMAYFRDLDGNKIAAYTPAK